MTFEKQLLSVSIAASQRLGILRMFWRVFYDRSLLGRCFRGFVVPFWSTVLQCGARLPIHTLNYWIVLSVVPVFLTGRVFECYIEHCRSVEVLCMLYKVRSNPMHPRYGALPSQYVPVGVHAVLWSHSGTLMRFLAAEPHSSAGHLFLNQYLCGTILVTSYSMVWHWRVSRAGSIIFYWPSCSVILSSVFPFSPIILWVRIVGSDANEKTRFLYKKS